MRKCVLTTVVGAMLASALSAGDIPRSEVFLGYTFVRANSATDVPAFTANGGSGQFIHNFNKWISGVADLGAVHNGNNSGFHIDNTTVNFLLGPRVSIRKWSRVTPYFQALFGGVYYTASTQIVGIAPEIPQPVVFPALNVTNPFPIPGQPVTARLGTSQTAFAMTAGGGLEIMINRHLRFRPIGLDYFMTRLKNLRTGGDNNQDNLRYSTGFTFTFGGEKPVHTVAQAATKTCWNGMTVAANAACPKQNLALSLTATSTEMCQGSTAQLNPSISGVDAGQVNYHWAVNGQPVSQGRSYAFVGENPGTYSVSLMVDNANFNPGSADVSITVREYRPPAGTVQANPAQIQAGEMSSLAANFAGQCGGTIQPATFTVSEGSVRGDQFDSTGVVFDPSSRGEQRKTVTVTASAADDRNTGTATTTIEVIKKASIAAIRLPDVIFQGNDARVNNCGKRILLEELRAYIQRDPTGTVVLVGHSSSDEKAAGLDLQRTLNSAAIITAGTGVCLSIPQSQVLLNATGADQNGVNFEPGFCGPSVNSGASTDANMRRVEVWFVPTGGQPPSSLTKSQDASSLPVSPLGCPK